MVDDALISIGVITYNQKKYIRKCLDSVLMQNTNFKFEIILNDDCSTDGTTEIIKEYAAKYPNIVKPFFHKENQYLKGRGILRNFVLPHVKTKYFAICEGDDYWTDPYKLQKQVDFLEAHPEYSACFHPVKVIWENGEHPDRVFPNPKTMKKLGNKITLNELLKWNLIHTNSIVYRWRFSDCDVKDYFPEGILPGDWYVHLLHAQVGDIAYIPGVMSVYRKNTGGIWYDEDAQSRNLHLKYGLRIIKFYKSVWENIANCSEEYWERLAPEVKDIMDNYYLYGYIDKLQEIKDLYSDIYQKVLLMYQNRPSKIYAKHKKYKKLFNILLVVAITQILIIVVLVYVLCLFL